jgi:predicted phage tail protein
MADAPANHDAASLRIIGTFFGILGILVLVATGWTLDNTRAMLVNLASGGVLTVLGGVMLLISRKLSAADESSTDSDSEV